MIDMIEITHNRNTLEEARLLIGCDCVKGANMAADKVWAFYKTLKSAHEQFETLTDADGCRSVEIIESMENVKEYLISQDEWEDEDA